MASQERVAVLFGGQGSHRAGFLAQLVRTSEASARVVADIDRVAVRMGTEPLGERFAAGTAPGLEQLLMSARDLHQLAVFGTSIGVHAVAREALPPPVAVVGHGMGEVAALVAGGALTVAEGAEVVIHRNAALHSAEPRGSMVALGCDAARTQRILDLVDDPWAALAAENGPSQTVVSGPTATISTVTAVARGLGIGTVQLPSPYPFHSPVLGAAASDFARRIAELPQRPLTAAVYSPTLGRFLRPDDAVADVLAGALVRRVRFADGVLRLRQQGVGTFWECDAGDGLNRLVQRMLPGVTLRSGPTMSRNTPAGPPDATRSRLLAS